VIPLVWLALAIAAGIGAWWIGWPAWRSYRARESRDQNADRYLAWRGRADRRPRATLGEGPTLDERRRLGLAVVLMVVAIGALVAFFIAT
jgi:hypothetical protein